MSTQTDQFLIPPHRTCITPTPVRSSVKLSLVNTKQATGLLIPGVRASHVDDETRRSFLPDLKPPLAKSDPGLPERAVTLSSLPQVVLADPKSHSLSKSLLNNSNQFPIIHEIQSEPSIPSLEPPGKFKNKLSKSHITQKDSARNLLNLPINISDPSVNEVAKVTSPYSPNFSRRNSPSRTSPLKSTEPVEIESSTTDIFSLSETSNYESKPSTNQEKSAPIASGKIAENKIVENSQNSILSVQSSLDNSSATEIQIPILIVESIPSNPSTVTKEEVGSLQLSVDSLSPRGKSSKSPRKSPRKMGEEGRINSEFRIKSPKRKHAKPAAEVGAENKGKEFASPPTSPPTSPKPTGAVTEHQNRITNNLDNFSKVKSAASLEPVEKSFTDPQENTNFYQKFSSFVATPGSPSEFDVKHSKKPMSRIRDTFQKSESASEFDKKSIPTNPNSEDSKSKFGFKLQVSNSSRSKKNREHLGKMAADAPPRLEYSDTGRSKSKKGNPRDLFFSGGSREDKLESREMRSATVTNQKRSKKSKSPISVQERNNQKDLTISLNYESQDYDEVSSPPLGSPKASNEKRQKKRSGSTIQSKSSDKIGRAHV